MACSKAPWLMCRGVLRGKQIAFGNERQTDIFDLDANHFSALDFVVDFQ